METVSEPVTPTQSTINAHPQHPFAHSKSLLEIIPNSIDIEEESRLYDELCDETPHRPRSPSVFSRDSLSINTSIWLADNVGGSHTFARDVSISGWTTVGSSPTSSYIVYDCVIKTHQGTIIHAHKRYSEFEDLEAELIRTLPRAQRRFIGALPAKAPLARYRPAFLHGRQVALQHWLASVLLHPDIGGCKAVRVWVME